MHDAHYSNTNPHGPYQQYRERPKEVKPSGAAAHEGFSSRTTSPAGARATANSKVAPRGNGGHVERTEHEPHRSGWAPHRGE